MITFEQQERWKQVRGRFCFDPADEAFWTAGLFDCLDGPGIAVVVLPADCLAQPADNSQLIDAVIGARISGLDRTEI